MITGVIIAGGQSSRLGTDKAMLVFNGKSLITYSIDLLKKITENIIISANKNEYRQFGFPVIRDEIKNIGPMAGLYSVLKALGTNIICVPCDMPYLTKNILMEILKDTSGYDCVVLLHKNGKMEPLCACYSPSILPLIEEKIKTKEFGLHTLIRQANTKYISNIEPHGDLPVNAFKNINTRDDLEHGE